MELIDREPLVRALTTLDRLARSDAQKALLGRVFYVVSKQPTVDAEPVEPVYELGITRCGQCNHEIDKYGGDNYCPQCGKAVKWDAAD